MEKMFTRQEIGIKQSREAETAHQEAVEFVENHRDILEHQARGKINIKPAPEGLDTFAFNLENNDFYVNSRFYKSSDFKFSDEKTLFATQHELEHFLEKMAMLGEDGGEKLFENYIKKIEESEAWSLMDNCIADIRENKAVIKKTSEAGAEIERKMYKEDLFKETDFMDKPKHIQLPYAILRESRVPGEKCQVSAEVREKLGNLYDIKSPDGSRLIDVMTDPETPMSVRLKLQDHYVWPLVKELREKDTKEKEEEEGKKGGGGERKEQEKKQKGKQEKQGDKQDKEKVGKAKKESDFNDIFKDEYEKAKRKIPEAVPFEEIKKSFKEWKESKGENPLQQADKEYAQKIGVKKEDLQKYRDIVKNFEKIINPETGESIIQELINLIERIIAKRLKPAPAPRYPVEEGEELAEPGQLVADVKAGNLEPRVWETYETKEKRGGRFGEVEITLVCDRSGSMGGMKLSEQQKAAVLMMEALKEFADRTEEEKVNLEKPLEIRSEIYSFQADANSGIPLKKMSNELGEKERVAAAVILSSALGSSTDDYIPLETISKNLSEESKNKIIEGELKKIVIVFTDGESNDSARVKKSLDNLRSSGVVTIGIGITEEGKAALKTYAPNARLAEKAENLTPILADLLKEHLADV